MTIEHPDRQAALAWANEAASSTHYMADLFPNRQARYLLHLEGENKALRKIAAWTPTDERNMALMVERAALRAQLASERTLREQAEAFIEELILDGTLYPGRQAQANAILARREAKAAAMLPDAERKAGV